MANEINTTTLDQQYSIHTYTFPGGDPNTVLPNAPLGAEATDRSTGNKWFRQLVSSTATWVLAGSTGGSGSYLPLTGGTLSGPLVVNSTVTIESAYQSNLSAGAQNSGLGTVLGVNGSTNAIQRFSQAALGLFLGGVTISGTWTISGNYIINGAATRGMQLSFGSTTLSSAVGATNPDGYPFLAYNAGIQNNTNSWSAMSSPNPSSRLVVTSVGISFYTAPAGRGGASDAAFWGSPVFSLTTSGLTASNFVGSWNGYSNNLATGTFTSVPDSVLGVSGTAVQRYTATAMAAFLATVTGGFTIGNVASTNRMVFGSSASTAFSLLTSANAYADFYVANITATSLSLAAPLSMALNQSVYWPAGGGGWYMSDTTFMRVYGNKMLYASGGILLDPGVGLQSNASGNATLSFVSGAPGYLDFRSGDTTVAGLRMFYNGAIRGYLYAVSTGFGLLNDQGNWSVQCNYGTNYGGTFYGVWNLNYPAASSVAPVAGVVSSSSPPTSSDLYPPNTIWLVT